MTKDCNLFQMTELHEILIEHLDALNNSSITCNIELPDMSSNTLMPVLQCIMHYRQSVVGGLIGKFLPYGHLDETCDASENLRSCIYKIPNLHAKAYVSRMLKIADTLQEHLCDNFTMEEGL